MKGIIFDQNKLPLDGIKVKFHTQEVITNTLGVFEFSSSEEYKPPLPKIIIENPKFKTKEIIPFDSNNKIKNKTIIVDLELKTLNNKKQLQDLKQIPVNSIDSLLNNSPKGLGDSLQQLINKYSLNILNNFTPPLIKILYDFGINDLDNLDNTTNSCISEEKLLKIIKKRNSIVQNINQIYKIVDFMLKSIGVLTGLIGVFKVTKGFLLNLPLPSTIGTPPGPQGGIIFSQTIGTLLTNSDNIYKLNNIIKKYLNISIIVLSGLIILKSILTQFLNILNSVDNNIKKCSEQYILDNSLNAVNPIFTLNNLISNDDSLSNNNVKIEVNNFILEIKNNKMENGLIQKQAIGKNKKGVVLVKGSKSFSSNDQILLDELEFYIKNNNLKAN